ncbi:uncharacterized protein LOC110718242 isoform X1 [Chenopodium quinoa]|uniref:uncharacterized protein LOC110718242 isoform X1 n=2 Tax=Chenopodium quinoa TaxID=63459 RepID=UPI000B78094E|nr:uncharacterized protein LOC110718242 isoform X1 [Chenopodium quinoa]XP_021752761.1 uncharacterized protein LOC110718242 isoform X1 [Chenopodium quinoa]XP_021752762.1 uncharacterized protein LOC110718242 isoform X1 [Chenopodium quinoa]XP_021752763.1 uncharacterized protein LOC110718242 isoform X1 [Chenopodium quinoa]XP_021752764.1 uncharacterized protein LOC110718242 isoform X1 [Chenopodium quinoa]XP_021752765.1 uncharacterized protein LOC110718242 isoform X1 [Chenopodium quinoa]XP_02175276
MGDQKEEDLYRNFSRKDLQGLCKKYGLPANKSNSEMATSLILYLEKKNLSTRAIWEGTRSDLFASGTTELQTVVRMNSTDNQRKDRGRIASHNSFHSNQCLNQRDADPDNLQNSKESATSDKASVDVGNLTQLHRGSNNGAGVAENTFSSVVSSSAVAPSPEFTFEVLREDGIQLYVDLNSSPSDWIESLTAGVHINPDVYKPKSQSFHEDIGILHCPKQKSGSDAIDPSKETDNSQLQQDGSYPTTILTDNLTQTVEPDDGEGSMSSPGLKCLSNAVHNLGNLQEEQAYLSSRLEPGTEWQLPGAKYCRREEILTNKSDINAAVRTRTRFNFTGNSVPSDPKFSEMPHQGADTGNGVHKKISLQQMNNCSLDPVQKCCESSTTVSMEMQTSTRTTMCQDIEYTPSKIGRYVNVVDQIKDTEQSELVKTIQTPSRDELQMYPAQEVGQRTSVSPMLKIFPFNYADNRSKVEESNRILFEKIDRQIREAQSHLAGNAGFLRTTEASNEANELQKKDAVLYPCYNDGSFEVAVPNKKELDLRILTKSNELQEDNCRSPSTANVGNLGKSDTGNGREGSKCLNSNNLTEKPRKKSSDSETTGEHKKKRNLNSVEHPSKLANAEAKNLRSSKQLDGNVHSKRRRSSRLFTK